MLYGWDKNTWPGPSTECRLPSVHCPGHPSHLLLRAVCHGLFPIPICLVTQLDVFADIFWILGYSSCYVPRSCVFDFPIGPPFCKAPLDYTRLPVRAGVALLSALVPFLEI